MQSDMQMINREAGAAIKVLTRKEELKILVDDFKELSVEVCRSTFDPKMIVKEGVKALELYRKSEDKNGELEANLNRLMTDYAIANNLETDLLLVNGIDDQYRSVALEFIHGLRKQYKVSTPQDRAYLQMAVVAYCRYHSNMRQYDSWKNHDFNSHERVAYMNMLSKDADRAFRQYHAVIQFFEVKQNPKIQVNVKANTAFVAQTQQNVANPNPSTDALNVPQ